MRAYIDLLKDSKEFGSSAFIIIQNRKMVRYRYYNAPVFEYIYISFS